MSRLDQLLITATLAVFIGFGIYQWGQPLYTSWMGQGQDQQITPAQARKRYFRKMEKSHAPPSRQLIPFELTDLSGNKRSSSEWRGKLLLLNFWAPWCGPCREEIPMLKSLQKQYGDQGLQIVGLGEDKPANVRDYAKHIGFNYPVLVGVHSIAGMGRAYGNVPEVLPFSVLIGRNGQVLKRHRGELNRAQVVQWIEKRLKTKGSPSPDEAAAKGLGNL